MSLEYPESNFFMLDYLVLIRNSDWIQVLIELIRNEGADKHMYTSRKSNMIPELQLQTSIYRLARLLALIFAIRVYSRYSRYGISLGINY